jgi:hypothetical protein
MLAQLELGLICVADRLGAFPDRRWQGTRRYYRVMVLLLDDLK